ncbi:MAG: DMT family transporter [Geminicoccaceae bacterium]
MSAGRPLLAITLALVAFATFNVMDTLVKLLAVRLHPVQIACFVALFALLPPTIFAVARGRAWRLAPHRWQPQLVRGVAMLIGGVCAFAAYSLLPLATAYAIAFSQPLVVAALSRPLLGERVDWRVWIAVVVGFAGVLFILRPGAGLLGLGAAMALVNSLCNGFGYAMIRRMENETVESLTLCGQGTIFVGTALLLPWVWQTPTPSELGLLVLAGSLCGIAFLIVARAFQLGKAAIVAPFQYSQILYAIVIGYLVFGDRPNADVLIGAAIVIGSGFYILQRERSGADADGSAALEPPAPAR